MAIAEACQLWIEQRIEEELKDPTNLTMSKRALARELAEEIDKYFEVKVNEETLKSRILRASGSNEPDAENPATTPVQRGDSGDKLTPQEVVREVDAVVKKGKSVREATKEVAENHGKRPDSIRKTYCREKERQNSTPVNFAINCAHRAIDALDLIPLKDADRNNSLSMVYRWIVERLYPGMALSPEDTTSGSPQLAEIVISQLRRIKKGDPGRQKAFQQIKGWISSQEKA